MAKIIVDSREPKQYYDSLLTKKLPVVRESLEVGDYLLPNNFAIERKTAQDFISSLRDNRLFTQLINMNQYDNPILVIMYVNKWKDFYYYKSKYIHKQFLGAITTITTKFPKTRIIYLEDKKEFIDFIESLYLKISKTSKSSRPMPVTRKATTLQERKENVLSQIQGLSIDKSKILLNKFGSIKNIAISSENDIKSIEGFGKVLAKNIIETLN